MSEAVIVIGTVCVGVLALIGAVFLIFPAHNTTAELWQRGETACEVNDGVKSARRYLHYLEVDCVNGAQFTIRTEIDE